MNRETSKAPFTNLPSLAALRGYRPEDGPCCTVEDFQVDLVNGPRSLWNKSAANVFADDFLHAYPSLKVSTKKIREMWYKHLERLKAVYSRSAVSEAQKKADDAMHRRKSRRAGVRALLSQL